MDRGISQINAVQKPLTSEDLMRHMKRIWMGEFPTISPPPPRPSDLLDIRDEVLRRQRLYQRQVVAYLLFGVRYGKLAGFRPDFHIGRPDVLKKAVRAEWVTETLALHGHMTAQELESANEVSKTGYPVQDVFTMAIELGFGSATEGFTLPPAHPLYKED